MTEAINLTKRGLDKKRLADLVFLAKWLSTQLGF
jgi:hypothetical protein